VTSETTIEDSVDILIVDDLPDKLLVLTTVLEELGQNLVVVGSGREALRQLMERDFAVILLDVNMPDMDGFETAALIRQHKRCAKTPIIFITAYADEFLTAKGYSLGAVDYILSPVVPEILRAKVSVFVELCRKTRHIERLADERIALARAEVARQEAEKANNRKDQFIAMLSHELRNPLAPIRNALHIFRDAPLDDPTQLQAREILERQVQQLSRIVDGLLDVFRLTNQKHVLRKEAVDLCHIVRQTVADHSRGIESEQKTLLVDIPGQPCWVDADPIRIAQVLANLLQNAGKFTNPGDKIVVWVAPDPQRERVAVVVEDSGIGIDSEALPHLFDPFAQGDQGMDRRHGGLGLGLALVRGLIELHGGGVDAASGGVGRGAKFSIWLPLIAAPAPAAAPETQGDLNGTPLRILIVEDNADTARTLAAILRHVGHQVEISPDGPSGIERARSIQPDVVLCDLGLPEMDGFEVARALRSEPATSAARLVAISGYGQEEDRRRCEEAGFDLHLTKPVDPFALQRILAGFSVAMPSSTGWK